MKNKNFLKKFAAVALGFVMTLGVGAAGYSASASETHAVTQKYTVSFSAAPSGAQTGTNNMTFENVTWSVDIGYTGSSNGWQLSSNNSKSNATFTTTAFSEYKIHTVSVGWYTNSKKYVTWAATVGETTLSEKLGNGSGTGSGTKNFDFSSTKPSGTITIAASSATGGYSLKSISVEYEETASSKTLTSISVSGTPNKTSYRLGSAFDPAGLVATGHYDDNTTSDITGIVEWNCTPSTFTSASTTSVSVVASYENISSSAYTVNGLTIKEVPTKPTDFTELIISSGDGSISDANFKYDGDTSEGISGIKGGTGKAPAWDATVSVPTGANKLVIYTAGWASGTTTVSIDEDYTTTNEITLPNESGMSNNSPFTLSEESQYADSYRQEFDLVNITSTTTITISFTDRAGLWYAGYKLGNVKTLKSIAVTTQPTKVNYNAGESFSTAGMVVEATYGNSQGADTTEAITNYTCSPSGELTSSVNQITISYTENSVTKTATVNIDVTSFKKLEYINNTKEEFKAGDTFDYDGSLREVYAHSSKADTYVDVASGYKFYIDDTEVTKSTVLEYGLYDVVVKYNNHSTDSYPIIVDYADPTGISMPSEYELGPGDSVNLSSATTVLPDGYAEKDITWFIDVTDGDLTTDNYSFNDENGTVSIVSDNKVAGELTVTAICTKDENISAECVITVLADTAPVVIAVGVTGTSTAGTQYVHKPLDMSGLTIVGYRDKDGNIEIPSDSPAVTYNPLEVGVHPSGKYTDPITGTEFTFTVTQINPVADSLASIAFANSAALSKTSYIAGEDWSSAGLSIVGTMASTDAAPASMLTGVAYSFNPAKPTAGTTSVEVTASLSGVADVKQSFTVSVAALQLESIEYISGPTKSEYILGETFNPEGLVIKGHYNLSSEDGNLDPSEYTLSEPDMYSLSPAGGTVVTVTSKENALKTCQFTITVNKKTVTPGGTTWNRVNNVSELKAGDVYTFGCANSERVALPMSGQKYLQTSTDGTNASFSNGVLTPNTNVEPVELTLGGSSGAWTFTSSEGTIGATAAKALSVTEGTTTWEISISEGSVSITSTQSGYGTIKYNTSSPRFLNYASGQASIELYHKVTTQGSSAELIRLESAVCNKTGIIPVGTTLEKSDFTVTGLYNDATTKTLAATDFEASGLTLNNVGDNVVTISATGLGSINVHVTAVQATKYEFKLMNGSSQYGETIQAIEGQTIDLPTLTEDGKTFNGWSDGTATYTSSYSMPAHDVTLNADWTVNHYTVTYSANGGTGTAPTDSNSYVYDNEVTVLSAEGLSKQYCTFGGWSDGNGHIYKAGDTFKITENVTLTADWSYIDIEITFDKNGGTGTNPQKVTMHQGSDYTNVKDPTDDFKAGHPFGTHFAGWNTQADGLGTHYDVGSTISNIMSDIKLYAEWKVDDIPVGGDADDVNLVDYFDNYPISSAGEIKGPYNLGNSSATFAKNDGGTAPKFYHDTSKPTQAGARLYAKNTMTISSSLTIIKIELSFASGEDNNTISVNGGEYASGVWEGEATSVVFTIGGSSGNRRINNIKITYTGGRSMPTDYTIAENLSGLGGDAPINVGSGITAENIGKYGEITKAEPVEFKAPEGKVITYADIFLLYDAGYSVLYSNDYGETYDYKPFDNKTRATRADEPSNPDLKETNAVKFTLNEEDKDIIKGFKVTAAFATNSDMSVDYDWEKAGNNYTIDITKACVRFSIDVDDSFEEYIGNDRYEVGFAISRNEHVIDSTGSIVSNASIQYYSKDYMPANNEFGLKINTKLQLNETYYVVLFVYDTVSEEYIEISKEKAASFKDVFNAYFTEEVVDGLNAQEKAVYDELYSRLYPSAQ